MILKGYWHLNVKGPNPDGSTTIYHPDVGEIKTSGFRYNYLKDEWNVTPWIEEPKKEVSID